MIESGQVEYHLKSCQQREKSYNNYAIGKNMDVQISPALVNIV